MNNPFKISPDLEIQRFELAGSPFFIADNFYADPDAAVATIMSHPAGRNKSKQPGFNGKAFHDLRHTIKTDLSEVLSLVTKLCGQPPIYDTVITNYTTFLDHPLNDYDNNYWWPHVDNGYNAIVYLNKDYVGPGTNLYNPIPNRPKRGKEHEDPWNPKEHWQLLHTFEAKYNRLVVFDGLKFYHGMSIVDESFFGGDYRLNQSMFFQASDS